MPARYSTRAAFLVLIGLGAVRLSANEDGFSRLSPDVAPNFAPATEGAEGGIWMIMNKAEEALKFSPNRLQDLELENYLKGIICRLAPDYCEDIRVYLMRVPHFNASMAPNGMTQVWTGLLLRSRNEAQIAAVLGHELGHYLKRHSLNRFRDVKNKLNIMAFLSVGIAGAVAAGGLNPDVGRAASDLGQIGLLASIFAYNRSQESDADQFGIQMMSDAGYEPAEAAGVWKNLIAEEDAATVKKERPSLFFSTHPKSENRMEKLAEYAVQLDDESSATAIVNWEEYQDQIGPHLGMLLEDELNLHQFGRTEFLFKSLLEDGEAPGLLNYYVGELYRIRNQEGDKELARRYYQEAMNHPDFPPDVHRSLGILYLKSRQFESARASFSAYLESNPEAPDREMVEYYMSMKE